MSKKINIRHISQTETKTMCFVDTKPDAIFRLNGQKETTLEIFVEDDLTKIIVNKVCKQLGISQFVSIGKFGAAINCFTLLGGMLLKKDNNIDNMLFVLDGDRYKTPEDKEKQIKNVLTGNGEYIETLRKNAIKYIQQLELPDNIKPEKFLHNLIITLNNIESEEHKEIIKIAKSIVVTNDDHNYINNMIERMNDGKAVGLTNIINLVSKSSKWDNYTKNIREWLESKKSLLVEEE
jgi:hypothetical protein